MTDISMGALPRFIFAHKFSTNNYHTAFPLTFNRIEISIITEGKLSVTCNGEKKIAQKGDIIFRYRSAPTVDSDEFHSHHTVCFSVDIDAEVTPFDIPVVIHSPANSLTCLHLIDRIIQVSILDPENGLTLSGLFLQLLGELDSICRSSRIQSAPGEYRYAERAKKYIYDHISDPILQNDIASFLGITPEYLCYVFKKCEGCSVIRFVNKIKLTRVRMLMENNQLSLSRASAEYGFSDPNYVSKLYKKYYNETITQAIKNLR